MDKDRYAELMRHVEEELIRQKMIRDQVLIE
jgi:hypothetical protein